MDKTKHCAFFENESSCCFVKGWIEIDNVIYEGETASNKIISILKKAKSTDEIKEILKKINGNFSFVIDADEKIIAAVDKIRSYPIFYCDLNNELLLSDSARKMQDVNKLLEKDELSFLEFSMAGYVTGGRTLYKDLKQLQAGEMLVWNKGEKKLTTDKYYKFWPDKYNDKDEQHLLEEYNALSLKVFNRLIKRLNGRPAWIPLSGGLDSRWILTMLLHLGYKNIVTFSYGRKGHPEVERAKFIAQKLNVPWHYVEYDRNQIRSLYHSKARKEYSDFADGLCSIPVLNDYYAIYLLKEKNMIPDNAVIVNGQSGDYLVGGHIPKIVKAGETYSVDSLLNEIIKKHFSLWANLKIDSNLNEIKKEIINNLKLNPNAKLSAEEFSQYYELWECNERQVKFVVNGQRVYDWFGLDWELPLWYDDLMDFWKNIHFDIKRDRLLHKKYLTSINFGKVFEGNLMQPHPRKLWEKITTKFLQLFSLICREDINTLTRTYLAYYSNYAPFYYQKTYFDFLKDSKWHRNQFSYLVKNYIKENNLSV